MFTLDLAPLTPASEVFEISSGPALNPALVYLESLGSEVSRRTMVSPLNCAAYILNPALFGKDAWREIPWQKITASAVRVIMAKMAGSPATRNKALAALKGVARVAWENQQMKTEVWMRIKSIKGDSGSREIAGRFVPSSEIRDLLKVCAADGSPAGARDASMLALAALTGARRAEIASIKSEDVHEIPGEGRFEIHVIGKRNKQRTLYVTGNAGRALADWLAVRGATSCTDGRLFCAIRKGGTILPEQSLSTTALDKILIKRSGEAQVADLDWHDLRRTTASNLLDAGADIATVAGMLGHSNIQTTARYDRRGERAKVKASELVSVPYFSRK